MPTSTIYAGSGDSRAQVSTSMSWTAARGSILSSASIYSNTVTNDSFGVYNIFTGGRGGSTYYCRRSYFPFDLSGESGTIESAQINIYLDNLGTVGSNNDDVTLVEATALAGTSADYGNCFSSGTTLGTEITSPVTVSTSAGYHAFTINSDGISTIQDSIGSGTFTVCLMGDLYDHTPSQPSLNSSYTKIHVYFSEDTSGSKDPYLSVTYKTENSNFLGTNF